MLPSLDYPYYELDIERGEICKPWLVKQETTIFINFVLTPLLKKKYIKKTMEIKLEYWLPGITMGASGDRQPVYIRAWTVWLYGGQHDD